MIAPGGNVRRLEIEPTWVTVDASNLPAAVQATLANAITLTPGTVSVDVDRGRIEVHCLTREIADELYPGGEVAHYATVQKLLDRLHSRRFVARRRNGNVNVFSAKLARDDLIRNRLRDTADQLCEGSMTPLLTQLVEANSLSKAEIAELRAMIDRIGKEEDSA